MEGLNYPVNLHFRTNSLGATVQEPTGELHFTCYLSFHKLTQNDIMITLLERESVDKGD